MLKVITTVLMLLGCLFSYGQQVSLNWYVFQSAVYLTPETSKEVHVLLEELENDSIIRFNAKFQTFNVATNGAIDVPSLCERLNHYGFYLGDVTRGYQHSSNLENAPTTIYSQAISYSFLNNKAPYNEKWLYFNLTEYQMLSDEVKEKIGDHYNHLLVD